MPEMFLHCKRQCTYVGSSETVLLSSTSCACLNHGNFASTGLFSGREKKQHSVIALKSKQYVDGSIIRLSTSHFTLPIDLMLLNKDILGNKTQFTRKFLHYV